MKAAPVLSKIALVTGCSTGIGLATARVLKLRGWHVIPTARKDEDLDMLRQEGFTPVRLDVADVPSIRSAVEETMKMAEDGLGALVNNAGFGQPGAVEDLTREALRYQFEVNVFGLQELTNRFVPAFRKQGYGRIVNVSSVLGRITTPMMGAYCASKHALESLSDALRVELRGSGLAVSIVEPGPIDTAFRDTARDRGKSQLKTVKTVFNEQYRKQLSQMEPGSKPSHVFMKPPESVALKILHAVSASRPRRRYRVTAIAHIGEYLHRFAPDGFMDWGMSKSLK